MTLLKWQQYSSIIPILRLAAKHATIEFTGACQIAHLKRDMMQGRAFKSSGRCQAGGGCEKYGAPNERPPREPDGVPVRNAIRSSTHEIPPEMLILYFNPGHSSRRLNLHLRRIHVFPKRSRADIISSFAFVKLNRLKTMRFRHGYQFTPRWARNQSVSDGCASTFSARPGTKCPESRSLSCHFANWSHPAPNGARTSY